MASRSAAAARVAAESPETSLDGYVPEGDEMELPLRGPASEVIQELMGGLRSAMSYVGASTIAELWEKARFIRQTEAGRREGAPRSHEG
jgi:IMP dehydrogenase